MNTNKGLLLALGLVLLLFLGVLVGSDMRVKSHQTKINQLTKELERSAEIGKTMVDEYNFLLVEYASCSAKIDSKRIVGKVSYYSHDGCLGCGKNQITASGEPFDENAYTLAIPVEWDHIKMGTVAIVKNLDTGKMLTAKINDRGGFLKYNRVADLSLALYQDLGIKTDKSNVEITF
jgi:rare lipoprotein A (peptidoglycan hydrolase)